MSTVFCRTIMQFYIWVVLVTFLSEIECCANQTILCRHVDDRQEICDNAVCHCTGTKYNPTNIVSITCTAVLTEIPLNQFPSSLTGFLMQNNSITTLKREIFSGFSYFRGLSFHYNKIQAIQSNAFVNLSIYQLHFTGNIIDTIAQHAFSNIRSVGLLSMNTNTISKIPGYAFHNTRVESLYFQHNKVSVIENKAFSNVYVDLLNLKNNNLTVLTTGIFSDIPKANTILLSNNEIEVIESQAFSNISSIDAIIMFDCPVVTIKSFAFESIRSENLQIEIRHAKLQRIEKNAFFNVASGTLSLGVDRELVFEENFIGSVFTHIFFTRNADSINCNCTMMWIALWLQEENNQGVIQDGASCNDANKTLVNNLTIDFFSNCRDMPEVFLCTESEAVSITCSLSFITGEFVEWIHTRNGRYIRTLKTLSNVLSIPFCSIGDSGDYTCVISTHYSSVPYVNTSTSLQTQAKPLVVNQLTYESGADLVISVTIYSLIDVTIEWFLDNKKLEDGSDYKIEKSIGHFSLNQYNKEIIVDGLTTNLTIFTYNSLSTQAYTCRISNALGTIQEVLLSRPIDILLQRNTLCDSASSLQIKCTLNGVSAVPKYFIHTSGGTTIRKLTGTRGDGTFTLVIPFCNYQDIGDYTCYWDAGVPGFENINKTTTVTVNGPPIILKHSVTELDAFTNLSVMFYSQPYPSEPKWYLNNDVIVPSPDIQQTTTFSVVEIQLHRVNSHVDGFITNLTVKTGEGMSGVYKCIVVNGYGSSQETIDPRRGQTTISSHGDSNPNTDVLPAVIGSVAAVLVIVPTVIIVVFLKRRKNQTKETRTYNEPDERRDKENYYDSIRMSARSATQPDYTEVF